MTLIISGHLKDHNSIVLRVSDRAQTGIRRIGPVNIPEIINKILKYIMEFQVFIKK